MKKLALAVLCVGLVGCDSAIKEAKEMTVGHYDGYTYGKVLENHKVCEDSNWETVKEDGVKKVIYTCELKKGKYIFNYSEKEENKIREDAIENAKKRIEDNYLGQIKGLEENSKAREAEIKRVSDIVNSENLYEFLDATRDPVCYACNEIRTAYDLAYDENPELIKEGEVLLEQYTFGGKINKGYFGDIFHYHREKMNKEQKAFYKKFTDKARPHLKDYDERHKTVQKEEIAKNDIKIKQLKEKMNDKKAIKKLTDKEGDANAKYYAETHLKSGQEVIVWRFNPVIEKLQIEDKYLVVERGDGKEKSTTLRDNVLIDSAIKSITDVDTYFNKTH